MLGFILLFIILSSFGVFCACVLDKNFEEGIPLYFLGVIFFLYLFYIIDLLKIGLFLVLFISFLLYATSAFYLVRKKNVKEALKRLITPGALCFSLLYLIIWYLTKDSLLYLFDELRLWGAYPKALYYTDSLQFEKNILYDGMKTYLPGMPLFQYFCMKILGVFQENYLHFSFCLLGTVLFLPLLKNIKWKNFYVIIPYIILVIFTPMIFYNNGLDYGYYYKSLYIDSILGLAVGYNFYLLTKNPYKNKFNLINYLLSIALVYLLKENGIIFCLISIFFSIVIELLHYKNKNYRKIKNYKLMIIPVIFLLFLMFSWKLTLSSYNKTSDVTSEFTPSKMTHLIINPTNKQKNIIKDDLKITNTNSMIGSSIIEFNKYLTYKNIMVFYILTAILIIILSSKKQRSKYLFSCVAIIGSSIAYWLALLFLYALKYGNVLCFERYNNTTLLAIFMFFSLIIIENVLKHDKKFMRLAIVLVSIIILIPFRSIGDTTITATFDYNKDETNGMFYEAMENEQKIIEKIKPSKNIINIYFASYEEFPIMHHRLYNLLLDNKIKIKNLFGSITNSPNKEAFVKYLLKENYDYVFVYNYDDEMQTFLEGIFDTTIKEETLYKIVNDDKIMLKEL